MLSQVTRFRRRFNMDDPADENEGDAENETGEELKAPLFEAIKRGRLDEVKQRILSGEATVRDLYPHSGGVYEFETPMLFAASRGQLDIVRWLLLHGGSNISEMDRFGNSVLLLASMRGKLEVIQCSSTAGPASQSETMLDVRHFSGQRNTTT
jgi:hypothetical protein